jgi:hypothetical protein
MTVLVYGATNAGIVDSNGNTPCPYGPFKTTNLELDRQPPQPPYFVAINTTPSDPNTGKLSVTYDSSGTPSSSQNEIHLGALPILQVQANTIQGGTIKCTAPAPAGSETYAPFYVLVFPHRQHG